ncbi:MAG: flagellar basal body-associated FliL family protein [Rickettsiales bacterium]
MADDNVDNDLDDDEEESGKKVGLIIIIIVVLLLAGGAAAYFLGAFDSLLGKGEHVEEEAPVVEHDEHGASQLDEAGNPIEAKITYYELPDFLVNLSTNTGQTSFLKMKVTLELPSEQDLAIAQEKLPILQDHFNTYLRDLRATDLSGSAGMYRLREELLARANKSLAPGKVNNILFSEILVQ